MPTDTEARDLLQQAADTIDVAPAAPLQPTRGRRTAVLAAAAAVTLIAGGLGVAGLARHGSGPAGPGPSGEVHVPTVFGYDAAGAQRRLEDAGLHPVIHRLRTCGEVSGRALRTRPAADTQLSAGSSVTLVVADAEGLPCPEPIAPYADREQPWRVVDLATGSGPTPVFADHVVLQVNDQQAMTVSGDAASDPDAWPTCDSSQPECPGSALDVITGALRQPWRKPNGKPMVLKLFASSEGSKRFSFRIGYEFNGPDPFPHWSIEERLDRSGSVTAVRLTYQGSPNSPVQRTTASATMTGTDPDGIGHRFVAFARGESDVLPVDTPVRLYLGHRYFSTITANQVPDRTAWQMCSGLGPRACRLSALTSIASYVDSGGGLRIEPPPTGGDPGFCLPTRAGPPRDTGGSHVVAIVPDPGSCVPTFEVDVYYNDVGQIVAVDLLLSES